MKILKVVKDYFKHSFNLDYWVVTYCDTFMEELAVYFLVFFAYVGYVLLILAAFVTFPIWIIPYLIFKTVTEKAKEEKEE